MAASLLREVGVSLRSLSAPILSSSERIFADGSSASISGKGIHSGKTFEIVLKAAAPGSGIHFKVPYLGDLCQAPALWTRLSGTTRSTALVLRGSQGKRAEIRTIEHLLAALWVYGNVDLEILVSEIDEGAPTATADVELQTNAGSGASGIFEVPILDGSSEAWLAFFEKHPALFATSLARHATSPQRFLRVWRIEKEFVIEDGNKKIAFVPTTNCCSELDASVDFGTALVQRTLFVADWRDPKGVASGFRREIAPARTFGFKHEVEELHRRGLARGGSLNNAILLDTADGGRVLNPEGFRLDNELARHKILDAIGDFALLGAPMIGRIELQRAGHSLHLFALKSAVDAGVLVAGVMNLDTGHFLADPA